MRWLLWFKIQYFTCSPSSLSQVWLTESSVPQQVAPSELFVVSPSLSAPQHVSPVLCTEPSPGWAPPASSVSLTSSPPAPLSTWKHKIENWNFYDDQMIPFNSLFCIMVFPANDWYFSSDVSKLGSQCIVSIEQSLTSLVNQVNVSETKIMENLTINQASSDLWRSSIMVFNFCNSWTHNLCSFNNHTVPKCI